MSGRVGAIVLAAGSSRRMGGGDKLLADLSGQAVLRWSLEALEDCADVDDVVVVTSSSNRADVAGICRGLGKVRALTLGGRERQNSVRAGLTVLRQSVIIAVHDGARPLITAEAVSSCIARVRDGHAGVIAGSPVADTIKVVDASEAISATPDRARLRAAATPQVFTADVLRRAHDSARRDGVIATDDAALVERLGERVIVQDIGAPNPKITTPSDLAVATALLGARVELRTGIGIDTHRLVDGRRLVLGGVEIAHDKGLAGHSDADALTHAIIDALLGAAGLGDIGAVFGANDPAWAGANSLDMLRVVLEQLQARGAHPQSVDATVIAERPRLRPHIDAIRASLAEALELDRSAVNVAATTAEGMGALGRAEGITVHAVATLTVRRPAGR